MAVSYYFTSEQPDLYQAQATIMVGTSLFQNPDPDPWQLNLSNTLANAYAEMVRQGPVTEAVIRRLGLDRTPEQRLQASRANIFLMRPNHPFRTLLLTSPGTSEGKSFILANLAVVLASAGNHVVMVDAECVDPRCTNYLTNLTSLAWPTSSAIIGMMGRTHCQSLYKRRASTIYTFCPQGDRQRIQPPC